MPTADITPPPATPPAGTPPPAPDFLTTLPEEYRGKEYLKDVKDMPSLLKKFDGAQELIGKRPAGIPQENAKPEEWAQFNKAWGVPEKPEEYDIGEIPKELPRNENFEKGMRAAMQEAGLNKRQAKIMAGKYNGALVELMKEQGMAAEKNDTDFEKLAVETFGERKDKALANGKVLLAKYAPKSMAEHVGKLSNENLIVLASVIDGIAKDYIKDDQLPGGKGGGAPTSDEKREEARKLMASPAFSDANHPEHRKTVDRVNSLYQ